MRNTEHKSTHPDSGPDMDLAQLAKEFNALNAFYACLCDALAEVMVAGKLLDGATVEGVTRCSRWLKIRMEEVGKQLEAVQRRGIQEADEI